MDATRRGEGVRIRWADVPAPVAAAVEQAAGGPVARSDDRPGGFSPGATAVLHLDGGRRVFVKAVGDEINPVSTAMHRREATIATTLPPDVPAPTLLATVEEEGWVALVYEAVDGRPPELPWRRDELDAVVEAGLRLAAVEPAPSPVLRPAPEVLASIAGHWARAAAGGPPAGLDPWSRRHLDVLADAEAGASEAVGGTSLLHLDIRADNVLVTPAGDVVLVDWPHAAIGAPWVDLALFSIPAAMQGGPPPEELMAAVPLVAGADQASVTKAGAAFAGYLTIGALQPDPPGMPTLRRFQAMQAEVARRWLAGRLGLPVP